MNIFLILVKKEIKELLTRQLVISIAAMLFVFNLIGKFTGEQTKASAAHNSVVVTDMDRSALSGAVIGALGKAGYKVIPAGAEEALFSPEYSGESSFITLPAGMQKTLDAGGKPEVGFYSKFKTSVTGMGAALSASRVGKTISRVNAELSDYAIKKRAPSADAAFLKEPMSAAEFVAVGGAVARVPVSQVTAFAQSQTYFFPIAVFFIVMLSAQMVMTAVASEKENKTLETLLSSPIDRRMLVVSKLAASAFIASLLSAAYMLGMRSFMSGVTGGAGPVAASTRAALAKLGLLITPQGYLLIGVSVLFCILCALSIAFILGALADDLKSVQGMMTPLMMMLMLSYLLPMFVDINSASFGLKFLLYAIPFTHAFIAPQNVMAGNNANVIWGIVYQAAVFAVFVTVAGRLFSGESLLTFKLRFGKK